MKLVIGNVVLSIQTEEIKYSIQEKPIDLNILKVQATI